MNFNVAYNDRNNICLDKTQATKYFTRQQIKSDKYKIKRHEPDQNKQVKPLPVIRAVMISQWAN